MTDSFTRVPDDLPDTLGRPMCGDHNGPPSATGPDDFQCSSLHGDDRTRIPHWHVVYDQEAD